MSQEQLFISREYPSRYKNHIKMTFSIALILIIFLSISELFLLYRNIVFSLITLLIIFVLIFICGLYILRFKYPIQRVYSDRIEIDGQIISISKIENISKEQYGDFIYFIITQKGKHIFNNKYIIVNFRDTEFINAIDSIGHRLSP